MRAIQFVTIETVDSAAAQAFYDSVFSLGDRLRVRSSQTPTSGFQGFTLSLVVSQPAAVRDLIDRSIAAGASVLKPAAKSLWGYGGAIQAPDGTVWTLASSSKKDTGPATLHFESFVVQLGVADVAASKQFYLARGFTVAKSYGRKYVEFDTAAVALTLLQRDALAKTVGVRTEGAGARQLVVSGDAGEFTDPDGFAWEESAE